MPGRCRYTWLLAQGKARLWRWQSGYASGIQKHGQAYPWLGELPRIFLK